MIPEDQLKDLITKLKVEKNPALELFNQLENLHKEIDRLNTIFGDIDLAKLEALRGTDGYSPVKGVDYWAEDELAEIKQEIIDQVTPVKYKDYFTQEEIDDLLASVTPQKDIHYRDGLPGKDAEPIDEERLIARILRQLPKPKDGKDGRDSSITIKDILDTIKSLKGTEAKAFGSALGALIDISQIKNAQTFMFNNKKYKIEELMRGGGGSSSTSFATNEVPSGTIDGSNKTFTLAHTPTVGSVSLYQDGLLFTPTTDYTISGATITMIIAPHTSALLLANYRY